MRNKRNSDNKLLVNINLKVAFSKYNPPIIPIIYKIIPPSNIKLITDVDLNRKDIKCNIINRPSK